MSIGPSKQAKEVTHFMRAIRRSGQTTAEYAVLIGIVVAAIVAMQVYVKRGIQAKVKGVTDNLTSTETAKTGSLSQYEPYYASSFYTVGQDRSAQEAVTEGYKVDKTGITEKTTRTGSATTGTDQDADTKWQ